MNARPSIDDMIEQARKWPRSDFGEGYWFNAMADQLEEARQILEPIRDCDPAVRKWLGDTSPVPTTDKP